MRPFRAILVTLVSASALTACSSTQTGSPLISTTVTTPRAQHTMRDLCEPLFDFFENELHAIQIRIDSPRELDSPHHKNGACVIESTAGPDDPGPGSGFAYVRRDPGEPDPTYGEEGFTAVPGYTVELWERNELSTPRRRIELATRIGDWNGQFLIRERGIRTQDGTLRMSEEQVAKAAQFIVDITQELQE